ncbi:MAG: DUF805 domain-containing protein [Alphaproteobacteria bacterium]|nr:DUF805 domain-containing protein [Alphaproteobacteria bacterium]
MNVFISDNKVENTEFNTSEMKTVFSCWNEAVKRFIDIKGRTTKYEFWSFLIVSFLIFVLLTLIAWLFDTYKIVYEIYGLYLIAPLTAVAVRRLHDIGYSYKMIVPLTALGALVLLNLEFDITNLFLTVFLWLSYLSFLCMYWAQDGEPQDNIYGVKVAEAPIYNQDSQYLIMFMGAFLAAAWVAFFIVLF